ncbi:hypothetical protein IWQ51_001494 [Labrenzia sp. EL_142]|nr:hypothetical protein [Labrenzia sp. EL_142]
MSNAVPLSCTSSPRYFLERRDRMNRKLLPCGRVGRNTPYAV